MQSGKSVINAEANMIILAPQIKCKARGAKSLDGMKTSIYL